jgi:hypothetical protein
MYVMLVYASEANRSVSKTKRTPPVSHTQSHDHYVIKVMQGSA